MNTFDPGINPSAPLSITHDWPTTSFVPDKQVYAVDIPKGIYPTKVVDFEYPALSRAQRDYILSFFDTINGRAAPFLYKEPFFVTSPESIEALLGSVADAGAPGTQRTYYVRFTWYDPTSGEETLASPRVSATVDAGYLMTVTIPKFPIGVSAFRVYAGEVAGEEYRQGYSNTYTWTESTGGLLTLTSFIPAENTLKPTYVYKLRGPIQELARARPYALKFTAERLWS